MLSLVDRPHASLTDLIHEDVVSEDQRLAFALPKLRGLKLRQLSLPHQFTGEFFSILGSSVWRKELSERVASENPAVFKLLDELFKSNGHLGASSYVQISSG